MCLLTVILAADGSKYIPEATENEAAFIGGCRCGAVQYTSHDRPSDIVMCHCRTCQHVSGSGYLPFVNVSKSAFKLTSSSTLKTLKLSDVAERTFCSSCGTPITMSYSFSTDDLGVTMSSIDLESLQGEQPKVGKHIYVREKAPWVVLPDDGAERWGTSEDAHLIKI